MSVDTSRLEITVALTVEDVAFIRAARTHYRLFAEVSEKQGQPKTAGTLRSQEFYAERLLERVIEAGERQGMPAYVLEVLRAAPKRDRGSEG